MALTAFDRKFIALTTLGGVLEFFDFIIFIYLADTISQLFFPKNSAFASLMLTFAIFAISYLIRPLGGIFFGHIGDKIGRRHTFILTITVMALPTLAISFLPTAAQIGLLAPILLLLCRIVQGLAIGGEVPGAITFLAENVNPSHRNLACATIFFGFNLGMLAGEGLVAGLQQHLSHAEFLAYGWRIPFFIGGVFGLLSVWLRRHLKNMTQQPQISDQVIWPIKTVVTQYPRQVVQGMLLVAVNATFIYLAYILLPGYLRHIYTQPQDHWLVSTIAIANLVFYSLLLLIMGAVADRLNAKKVFQFGCWGLIGMSFIFFYVINYGNIPAILVTTSIYAIFTAAITCSFPVLTCELFPQSIRYTGVGLSYNLAFAIFGGTTPLMSTFLIKISGSSLTPAFYLILIGCWGLLASRFSANTCQKLLS